MHGKQKLPPAAYLVGDGFFSIHRNKDDTGSQPTLMEEFHSFSFSNVFFFLFKKLYIKVCFKSAKQFR